MGLFGYSLFPVVLGPGACKHAIRPIPPGSASRSVAMPKRGHIGTIISAVATSQNTGKPREQELAQQ